MHCTLVKHVCQCPPPARAMDGGALFSKALGDAGAAASAAVKGASVARKAAKKRKRAQVGRSRHPLCSLFVSPSSGPAIDPHVHV